MVELAIHAKADNVARRFTALNDNDMMHACMEETTAPFGAYHEESTIAEECPPLRVSARRLILTPPTTEQEAPVSPRKYDHDSCQELASHIINANGLPAQCKQYTDVVTTIRRRRETEPKSSPEPCARLR